MFRYRCPQCSVVLQAPEIRAGKTTVCSKCSRPLTIPADPHLWLNEKGEPLLASPTMVVPSSEPAPQRLPQEPEPDVEPDNDMVSAEPPLPREDEAPAPVEPPRPVAPAFSRSLPLPDEPDDGRVELYPTPLPPPPVAETPRPPATPPPKPLPRHPAPPPQTPSPTPPPREPVWAGSPGESGPRPRRLVSAPAEGNTAVEEPLRLRTGMDLAVDLTSALASRMKPAPKPPRDLKPSTAVWILTTAVALGLLAATLTTTNNFLPLVIAIGAAQALAGYAWVTTLAFRRDVRRGLACALPPITFVYLGNWKYAKYRPLRFVLSGGVILGMALLAPRVQSQTRSWAGAGDNPQPIEAAPPIASQSKLVQLRYYRDQRQYDSLLALLRTLARTDSMYSEAAKDRADLAADLKALCKHTDYGVKVEALAAYATWGGPDARELCLEASRSLNREERLMALKLLPGWKDEDVARRIAEMIGRAGTETSAAQDALVTLGGTVAERAAIPLLKRDDQGIRLAAIEILGHEKVGGADAVAALKEIARISPDPGTRLPAEAKAQQIQDRLNK